MTLESQTADPAVDQVEDLTGFDVDPDNLDEGDGPGENFKKLRSSRDQWKTRAEASEERAWRGILLEAGYNPDSGEGKALLRALEGGEVEADPGAIVAHAADEYGWEPDIVLYSRRERQAIDAGQRQQALGAATTSDTTPPGDLETQIAAARDAGDFGLASKLQREADRRQGR